MRMASCIWHSHHRQAGALLRLCRQGAAVGLLVGTLIHGQERVEEPLREAILQVHWPRARLWSSFLIELCPRRKFHAYLLFQLWLPKGGSMRQALSGGVLFCTC